MTTHPFLLFGRFFCLARGTGGSGCISVLLNRISPVVSRLFAVTQNKSYMTLQHQLKENSTMLQQLLKLLSVYC